MGYEVIEHTADAGLHVWAPTLEELFADAARGLFGIMGEGRGPRVHTERVTLEAPDREALLVDWLSELLFLFEARGVVPEEVGVRISEDPWRLEADIGGSDAGRFVQGGPAVKAITYHAIEVRATPTGVEGRVYVDV